MISKAHSMMKIQIGSLSEGLHEYQFETDAGDIDLGEGFAGPVAVKVVLEKTGNQMRLTGSVSAAGSFPCDRCTREFSLPVSASYRMYYVTEGGEFAGIDPSELQVVAPGSGWIDIQDDVRQTILLAVPLKLLCSDQCRGLCPHCGKNLNTESCSCTVEQEDTRWEALKPLRGTN